MSCPRLLLACSVAVLAASCHGRGAARGDGGVAPWPAEFATYPGARRLCAQRAPAGALRVRWTAYASTDDVATVAAFYARTSGGDPAARPFVVRGHGLTTLAVHDAAALDYPRCPQGPAPDERSIILVTTAAARLAPAKEAR